jgi:hypothetical protein
MMMKRSIKALLLSTFFAVCSGLVLIETSQAKPSRKHRITAYVKIVKGGIGEDSNYVVYDDLGFKHCRGQNEYDDIKKRTPITVADENGKIIAVDRAYGAYELADGCYVGFNLENLPKVSFYSLEIGRRKKVTYSYEQMVRSNWTIDLTIGG